MTVGDGFQADQGVIADTATMLRSGSNSLERLGGSVPPPPDAGDVSGIMGSLMSKLVGAAGEISTGAAAAADEVDRGGAAYLTTDGAVQHSLPSPR
jgi:hypothetical protein